MGIHTIAVESQQEVLKTMTPQKLMLIMQEVQNMQTTVQRKEKLQPDNGYFT